MKRIILISLIVSLTSLAFGQEIQFKTGNTIRTIQQWNGEKVKESFVEKETSLTARTQFSEKTDYYWIAFKDVINNVLKAKLDFLGVEIIGYAGTFHGGRLYKISVNGRYTDVFDILKQEKTFINLIPVWVEEKMDKNILENRNLTYVDSVSKKIKSTIYFYKPMEKEEIEHLLGNFVDTIIFDEADKRVVHIISTRDELLRIAEIDYVKIVGEYQEKMPLNSHARELTKVNELQDEFITIVHPPTTDWLSEVPHTGDGIWICINEGIDASHLDFHEDLPGGGTQLRKSHPDDTWSSSDHGTHVAGVAAGNGWNSHLATLIPGDMLQWRGVAPKALLSPTGEKGDVNNHSFTESFVGYYNYGSSYRDEKLSNHGGTGSIDNNICIWSAGNNGGGWAQYGVQKGYYSMLVNSKNAIKVGATEKDKALKAEFSSMGPSRDGRIGPDICAPGSGLAEREAWHIQIDYILIENNGVEKARWDFSSASPDWGIPEAWRIFDLEQSNGTITFSTVASGYLSSNGLLSPPFQSHIDDELVINWKVSQTSSSIVSDFMKCRLYWRRDIDSYYKKSTEGYAGVIFTCERTGDWQETRILLTDLNWQTGEGGGWVSGDEVTKIRLDFLGADPHGHGLVSCYHGTNDYVSWNGTSMSGPHVTGIVALMLQKYRDEVLVPLGGGLNIHDNPFWNSTAKAILIHTATDLVSTAGEGFILDNNPDFASQGFYQPEVYGFGPDFATGYGLVNAVKALEYVDTDKFVEDTIDLYETKHYLFNVPPGTQNFRVTLAWDDPPYVGDNSVSGAYDIKLVNNIDLYLTNIDTGEIVRPWVLDHSMLNNATVPVDGLDPITPSDISDNPCYRDIDNRNNVEVVDVEWPDVGLWAIVVEGTGIAQDQSGASGINQDISLVLDFPIVTTTSEFVLTANDQHAIDVRLSCGDGTFAFPVSVGDDLGVNYGEFAIADFTGDGQLDFIASTNENPARLYLFTRTGPISFQQDFLTALDSDPKAAYYLNGGNDPLRAPDYGNGLTAADLNNDGHMDFLENINHDFGDNKYWIAKGNAHINDGSGSFTRVSDAFDFSASDNIYTGWTLGMSNTIVDVDGDCYPDMLASEQSSGGTVSSKMYLLKGNGNGTFQAPVHVFTTNQHPATHMTLGDFNNDGKVDAIIGQDDDGDPGAAFLFLGHGDGTFEQTGIEAFDALENIETGSDQPGHGRFQAYDADSDGVLDIIAAPGHHAPNADELDAELLFFHGRGDGTFDDAQLIDSNILTTTAFVTPLTFPLDVKVRGDLDCDRDVDYDDYLIFRTAYGSCSGDDNFLVAADFDGDGCVTINDYRILRTLITG